MKYNNKQLIADHGRLATNTFWNYLLEELQSAYVQQGISIGNNITESGEKLKYEQGRFNQMNPEMLKTFINDLVFKLKEAIKSG